MPAKDIYHESVIEALIEEGWQITHDPLIIRFEGITYHIDLGAEEVIAAEKDGKKIAVEIKSFVGVSFVHNFHEAIGQFTNYLVGLEEKEPDRVLYLAIPQHTYDKFFHLPIVEKTIKRVQVKILVYNPGKKKIIEWIK